MTLKKSFHPPVFQGFFSIIKSKELFNFVTYSTFKVRWGGCQEIPFIQDKEQQLCFAGAAVKRYPMSKVRGTQVRQ